MRSFLSPFQGLNLRILGIQSKGVEEKGIVSDFKSKWEHVKLILKEKGKRSLKNWP